MAADARFELLPQVGVSRRVVDLLVGLVETGSELELAHLNAIQLARDHGLPPHEVIAGFLHASRVGLFDMQWNIACPGCGGILDARTDLKSFAKDSYPCSLCATAYEPTLDELVEVVFTPNRGVRRLPSHDPESLAYWEYMRLVYMGSSLMVPEGERWQKFVDEVSLVEEDLAPGERATISFALPSEFLIVLEPVTHTTHFIDVQGDPADQKQELNITYAQALGGHASSKARPGPMRLTFENRTDRRLLPGVFRANDELHHFMSQRRAFLTAKQLITTQAFRDLYKAETLTVDQRLKIGSLTVLFTDLRGSTELYERIGDLAAYDLVRHHFQALHEVVKQHDGAVVKTIGDAVMATFATPREGLGAALGMHEAMQKLNASHNLDASASRDDLVLKIGLHEGPCLAVTLNDRLDYFGQTVNIAARVQGIASPQSIYVTDPIIAHESTKELLSSMEILPVSRRASLKGIRDEVLIYEITPRSVAGTGSDNARL